MQNTLITKSVYSAHPKRWICHGQCRRNFSVSKKLGRIQLIWFQMRFDCQPQSQDFPKVSKSKVFYVKLVQNTEIPQRH